MAESPARVLALHAFYQILGGEDVSHRSEVQYLRDRGHEVLDVTVDNAALGELRPVARLRATVSNPATAATVTDAIARFRPDVAYANNLFPGLSSSVIAACRDAGVPVVRVLRNYRFTCVSGNLFRDGTLCTDCVGNAGVPGVVHGCYRGSRPVSAVATVARHVDRRASAGIRWIANSRYVRDRAIEAGLDGDRIAVRPNLSLPTVVDAPVAAASGASTADGPTVLFVGRDTVEKGLPLLLEEFARLRRSRPHARLVVAGAAREHADPGVTWLGAIPHARVAALMAAADVLAVPSVWPEPFGRVAVEALAVGTPVVAAATGGLAELGGQAVRLFDPSTTGALAAALDASLDLPRGEAREAALARFAADFAPDVWYRGTVEVFARAIEERP